MQLAMFEKGASVGTEGGYVTGERCLFVHIVTKRPNTREDMESRNAYIPIHFRNLAQYFIL